MIVLIGGHRESVLKLNNSCWFIVVCCWITMDVKNYKIRCVVVLGTHIEWPLKDVVLGIYDGTTRTRILRVYNGVVHTQNNVCGT